MDIKPGQTWLAKNSSDYLVTKAVDPMTMHACCGFQADPVWYVDLYSSKGVQQYSLTTSYIRDYYRLGTR